VNQHEKHLYYDTYLLIAFSRHFRVFKDVAPFFSYFLSDMPQPVF